jgi:chemotaxis protein methyltransferase CheR
MGFPSANSYQLSDHTYRQLTDLIYSASGLRFEMSSKYMISRRLAARLDNLELESFEKYLSYLMYHPNREIEMDSLFDLVTTHETYFFREDRQLKAFSDEILPQLLEARKQFRTLRIWSAGCSSGEEPYTIAILCKQTPELRDWNVDIFASDISQHMVHAARRGIYSESSFRNTKEEFQKKYFVQTEEGRYRIKDEIRQMVTFMKLNLVDDKKAGIFGEMDVIFCRNVIIYFGTEAKKKVVDSFYHKLRKEGYLLLGHSESLLNLSTRFKLKHLKNDLVYQK